MMARKLTRAAKAKAFRHKKLMGMSADAIIERGMKPTTVDAACALDLLSALNNACDALHQETWIADGVSLAIRGAAELEDFQSVPLIRLAEVHAVRLSEIRDKMALAAAQQREKLIAAGALASPRVKAV